MAVLILHPDGGMVSPKCNFKINSSIDMLKWCQEKIAAPSQNTGYVEIIRLGQSSQGCEYQIICNEDGMRLCLEENKIASLLYTGKHFSSRSLNILGTVIILSGPDCID